MLMALCCLLSSCGRNDLPNSGPSRIQQEAKEHAEMPTHWRQDVERYLEENNSDWGQPTKVRAWKIHAVAVSWVVYYEGTQGDAEGGTPRVLHVTKDGVVSPVQRVLVSEEEALSCAEKFLREHDLDWEVPTDVQTAVANSMIVQHNLFYRSPSGGLRGHRGLIVSQGPQGPVVQRIPSR